MISTMRIGFGAPAHGALRRSPNELVLVAVVRETVELLERPTLELRAMCMARPSSARVAGHCRGYQPASDLHHRTHSCGARRTHEDPCAPSVSSARRPSQGSPDALVRL